MKNVKQLRELTLNMVNESMGHLEEKLPTSDFPVVKYVNAVTDMIDTLLNSDIDDNSVVVEVDGVKLTATDLTKMCADALNLHMLMMGMYEKDGIKLTSGGIVNQIRRMGNE